MGDRAETDRESADDAVRPGPEVTLDLYRQWRAPRYGRANPERMNNPVWEWLVRVKINAWWAYQLFGRPTNVPPCPGWCFDRFGQSETKLADGRIVLIAGEHEDYYDPDFNIYNDVVVLHPDGAMDIFGYPREVFRPTDFHSATLAGNRIVLVGGLGYVDDRRAGETAVAVLDLDGFVISVPSTTGDPPGWLHKHQADLVEDGTSILVRGGQVDRDDDDHGLFENLDDWKLHLAEWRWERLTDRRWHQWSVVRCDGKPNNLWSLQAAASSRSVGMEKDHQETLRKLGLDFPSDAALEMVTRLYRPEIPHETMPERADEFSVHRIRIDGVIVRYVDDLKAVRATVEGELPLATIDALAADLRRKMEMLEGAPCEVRRI